MILKAKKIIKIKDYKKIEEMLENNPEIKIRRFHSEPAEITRGVCELIIEFEVK